MDRSAHHFISFFVGELYLDQIIGVERDVESIKFFLSHLGRSQFTNSDLCKVSILHADIFALGSLKPFSDGGGSRTAVYMYLQTMPRRVELEIRTFGLFLSIGVQTFIFVVEGGQQASSGRSRHARFAKMSPLRLLAIALGYREAFSANTWPGPSFLSELAALKAAANQAELLWGAGDDSSEKIQIESVRVQGRDHQTGEGADRDNAVFFRLPNLKFCSNLKVGLIAACVRKHEEPADEGDSEETDIDGEEKETDLRIILRNQFNHHNNPDREVPTVVQSFNGTLTGSWPKLFHQQVDISECRMSSSVLCAPNRDRYIGHFSKLL